MNNVATGYLFFNVTMQLFERTIPVMFPVENKSNLGTPMTGFDIESLFLSVINFVTVICYVIVQQCHRLVESVPQVVGRRTQDQKAL